MSHKTSPTVLALAAALVLGACASPPATNPALEAARATVERAQGTPSAARAGGPDLERARQTLRRADAAWSKDGDIAETAHLAYLARQRAEIALAMGAQADAEDRMQQASAERDRTRLAARTREAEAATRAARAAQSDAALSRAQSELLAQQAAILQQQAEAARRQAQASQSQAAMEAERAAALQRDLQALAARNTARGMVITLGDVLFDTGKASLQPGAMRSADQLASVLKQYPERRVMIEGFTDSVGSDEMNLDLSRRRAGAFQTALMDRGIAADRIEVKAQGEAFPVADNNSAAGRQQNRRVEVLFSDPQGHFVARPAP